MNEKNADRYIVTATGTKDGQAYSTLTRIVEGEKKNGDKYAFLDTQSRSIRESEIMTLGAIVQYKTARVAATAATATATKTAGA